MRGYHVEAQAFAFAPVHAETQVGALGPLSRSRQVTCACSPSLNACRPQSRYRGSAPGAPGRGGPTAVRGGQFHKSATPVRPLAAVAHRSEQRHPGAPLLAEHQETLAEGENSSCLSPIRRNSRPSRTGAHDRRGALDLLKRGLRHLACRRAQQLPETECQGGQRHPSVRAATVAPVRRARTATTKRCCSRPPDRQKTAPTRRLRSHRQGEQPPAPAAAQTGRTSVELTARDEQQDGQRGQQRRLVERNPLGQRQDRRDDREPEGSPPGCVELVQKPARQQQQSEPGDAAKKVRGLNQGKARSAWRAAPERLRSMR